MGRPAAPLPSPALPVLGAYGREDHFAFCVSTVGNVGGSHSATIKLLEAAA